MERIVPVVFAVLSIFSPVAFSETKPTPPGIIAPADSCVGQDCVLAERDSAQVTIADLQAKLSQMEPQQRSALLSDPKQINKTLENLLILRQLAQEVNVEDAAGDKILQARLRQVNDEVLAVRRLDQVREERAGGKFDQLAKEYYQANIGKMKTPTEVTVRHILIDPSKRADSDAKALAESIVKKAASATTEEFADLVMEYSDDPSKVSNGGVIKVVEGSQELDPDFLSAALEMNQKNVGEIRGPVRSQFGYHVIQLIAEKDPQTLSFDEVRESIMQKLQADQRRRVVIDYRGEVMSRGETRFYPENLTKVVYADDPLQVQ